MPLIKHKTYSFISKWIIVAPLKDVWPVIYESELWPQWWKSVVSVKETVKGDDLGIGSVRIYKMRSPMFYTLSFHMLVTERVDYKLLRGEASGELSGEGIWYFKEQNGETHIECHWNVASTLWWMNLFAFLLKPIFQYNHAAVMKDGATCLGKKLNTTIKIIS